MTESELKTLLEVAEHVAGPFKSALHEVTWREEFRQRFTPATCAELVREVLRLRAIVMKAGDTPTTRAFQKDVNEFIEEHRNHE